MFGTLNQEGTDNMRDILAFLAGYWKGSGPSGYRTMDLTKRYKQNKEIVYREEDEGAFLFDPDTGDLRYMNQSGRETFLMLKGDKDTKQVIDSLLDLYPEVEPAQMQSDVEDFLKDLEENHFILPLNSK